MKKTLITALTLIVGTIGYVNAQTQAGNKMIGGGISFSSSTSQSSDAKQSSVSFTPQFGYFVADNFAVGLALSIGSEKEDNVTFEDTRSTWGVAPFARYYMFTSSDKFAFFGQAALQFGGVKESTTRPGIADQKSSSLTFAVSPGFAYFFNEHWALDIYLRGLEVRSEDPDKDNDDDKTTDITFDVNSLAPNFGIRYHF